MSFNESGARRQLTTKHQLLLCLAKICEGIKGVGLLFLEFDTY